MPVGLFIWLLVSVAVIIEVRRWSKTPPYGESAEPVRHDADHEAPHPGLHDDTIGETS